MTRVFDFTAAAFGLVVLSPLMLMIGLCVRLADGGPALFLHPRVGRGGRVFRMMKFRSMRVKNEGAGITVGSDERITPVGRWLRRTKFDEFPQLINVLRGEMALVGPRPEIETYVKLYKPDQIAVLDLRPGITDPASFAFYDEEALLDRQADPHRFYEDYLLAEKIRINLEYAQTRTLMKDVFLVLATVLKPLGIHLDVFRRLGLTRPNQDLFA